MFRRNDKERTPKQRAERAQMSIFARLAGCAYLIYIMVKLLRTPSETAPATQTTTIIAIIMIVLSIVVIGFTAIEFLRGLKTGVYKTSTYEDADLEAYLEKQSADGTATMPESAEISASDEDEHKDS